MPRRIVLLISDPNCGQAQLIANAVLRGYNNVQASAYCYRNGSRYDYAINQQTFQVTNRGQLGPNDTFAAVCASLQLGQGNGATMGNSIDEPQLDAICKLTKYSDSMTTLDPARIPAHWLSRATHELGLVVQQFAGDSLCFIIAPNPRNVPVRLQTFGHKLSWNHGVVYQKRSGGIVNLQHLVETKIDAVASLTEVAFCQVIIGGAHRFLGNCYGAQLMWLSLGGGVTAFKRNAQVAHGQTLVPQVAQNQPVLNVNWNDGVTMGGRINGNANNRNAVTQQSQLKNFQNVTYNTDYFHSCMMIHSKAIEQRLLADLQGIDSVQRHELADIISGDNSINNPNEFIERLQAYADSSRYTQHADQNKQQRTWGWVGEYHFDQRISGYQGHPLLFLHLNLPNQQDTLDLMSEQMFG